MAFFSEHPKLDQNPKFTPLSETTTSIPGPFKWKSTPPGKKTNAMNTAECKKVLTLLLSLLNF